MTVVQRVRDFVGSPRCVEVRRNEVEVDREFDGLRANAVPVVRAYGGSEVESIERDDVGVGAQGHVKVDPLMFTVDAERRMWGCSSVAGKCCTR